MDDRQNNRRLEAGLVIRFKVSLAAHGEYLPRWEWLRSWCSEVGEVWVGLWVESVEILGQHPVTY